MHTAAAASRWNEGKPGVTALEECAFSSEPVQDINFWALSDHGLSDACLQMAEGNVEGIPGDLRAEAGHLLMLWDQALGVPDEMGQQRARRNWLISGLRKRTIQVLVRLSMQAAPPTPEY